jgi:DNA-directed RNA polymerase subunit L
MKVNLIEKNKNELKVEVQGEGHTLLNLLQSELLADKNVEVAEYVIPHMLVDAALFYVKTKGKISPLQAFVKATKAVDVKANDFLTAFQKASKEYDKR